MKPEIYITKGNYSSSSFLSYCVLCRKNCELMNLVSSWISKMQVV